MKTALVAAAMAVGASGAAAQTCTVSATGVAFGAYDGTAPSPTDATGTVTVSCLTVLPVSVAYAIQLNGGVGGTIATRKATAGASSLLYQLYVDAAHSSVWGDGTSGSTMVSDSYGLGALGTATRNYTVYGRIPISQRVAPGAFVDLITVLINY